MRNGPDYIQLYPTLRCNQSCAFCFNRSLSPMADMSLEAFREMLGRLTMLAVKTLDIIGGEPTVHPDIIRFIAEAAEKGFHINLSSNGTDSGLLEESIKAGDAVSVGVSINDREALKRLKGFIAAHHPIVKSVFSRSVDLTLADEILAHQPKKFFSIYRDATSHADLDETIPFPQYMHIMASRFHPQQVGMVYCSGFIPDSAYPELATVRCPAGTTKLGVMPDGSVYPCNLFFGNADFLLGNILTDPFEAVWNHPRLAFFRAFIGNTCPQRSCEHHAACHGGCPAQALLLSGDLAAPDPRCHPAVRAHSENREGGMV
jgi:radical SAM protein with 4Fe4S-binding SPASM domain